MLSLKYIRENLDQVKESTLSKNVDFDFDSLLKDDKERRFIIQKVEQLKAERNIVNKEISKKNNIENNIENIRSLSKEIKMLDSDLNSLDESINERLLFIPNIVDDSVPIGANEKDNKVIKEWGTKPNFDFEVKSHIEISEKLNLLDFRAGSKISGSGFPVYIKKGAKLERSLINFMLDMHVDNGYDEMFPPFLVNSDSMQTTGQITKFIDDMYQMPKD